MTRPSYDETEVGRDWRDGEGTGEGVVGYTKPVERETERNEAVRNAEADDPAYETQQADGGRTLTSRSELGKT